MAKFLEKYIMNNKNKGLIMQNAAYQIENYDINKGYQIEYLIKNAGWIYMGQIIKPKVVNDSSLGIIRTTYTFIDFDIENGVFGYMDAIKEKDFDFEFINVEVKEIQE